MSKTIYDGSNIPQGNQPGQTQKTISGTEAKAAATILAQSKEEELTPLIGFLVSFSRSGYGEYWGLREGNLYTMGKAADCHIRLSEASVSDHHALLHIRRSNDSEKRLMIVVTDTNSTNGTVVNNKDIGINGHVDLKHLDKILIGQYELMFLLVDRDALELKQNENFKQAGPAATPAFDYSSQSLYNKPTRIQ